MCFYNYQNEGDLEAGFAPRLKTAAVPEATSGTLSYEAAMRNALHTGVLSRGGRLFKLVVG